MIWGIRICICFVNVLNLALSIRPFKVQNNSHHGRVVTCTSNRWQVTCKHNSRDCIFSLRMELPFRFILNFSECVIESDSHSHPLTFSPALKTYPKIMTYQLYIVVYRIYETGHLRLV